MSSNIKGGIICEELCSERDGSTIPNRETEIRIVRAERGGYVVYPSGDQTSRTGILAAFSTMPDLLNGLVRILQPEASAPPSFSEMMREAIGTKPSPLSREEQYDWPPLREGN